MPNNTPKIINFEDLRMGGSLFDVPVERVIEMLEIQTNCAIEYTIDAISDENGWEETRDYWRQKLLNQKK